MEFPENVIDFKPEILPVKDLQILKPVLWGDLTYDENIPTVSFYEDVQKISPHPLQYDVIIFFIIVPCQIHILYPYRTL